MRKIINNFKRDTYTVYSRISTPSAKGNILGNVGHSLLRNETVNYCHNLKEDCCLTKLAIKQSFASISTTFQKPFIFFRKRDTLLTYRVLFQSNFCIPQMTHLLPRWKIECYGIMVSYGSCETPTVKKQTINIYGSNWSYDIFWDFCVWNYTCLINL